MSGLFTFPHAYDPQMHKEEAITLARTTSQASHRNASYRNAGKTANSSPMTRANAANVGPRRRHFAFADPVAFRYLEEDSATVVIERGGQLRGYELYLVEQWACSRVHPTFIITTYTGDPTHAIRVGVLGVPADEETWSPRLRVYFKAIAQYHARPKETPLGMLMVTNLTSFPSALTVIPVPEGDVKKYREDFIVNENLKRLGCSGRSGMSLSQPAGATQAKFFQLYKTSDRIPLYSAVIELVKLNQVALMIFGKLEQEYADGMLCDVTEKAINDWWTEIGSEYFNVEPSDGILGPTTVAALLGMLTGARNRLNYYGAPVAKDAFDVYSLKRGIAYFQKGQKLERTRRLDRHTLDRLHRVTAKAASGEGWAVPKAVKSTVAELSGKGGEMVMGMVGRGDKAGIADIETLDIDRFVSLVHGERLKWLFYGKPRKTATLEDYYGKSEPNSGNLSFTKNDQGGYKWSHNRADSIPLEEHDDTRRKKEREPVSHPVYLNLPPGSATSMVETPGEPQPRKNVFKSVTGKMSDARSGFGSRIKDAVGLRHSSKPSKDEGIDGGYFSPHSSTTLGASAGTPISPLAVKAFTWKDTPEQYHNGVPKSASAPVGSTNAAQESESEGSREHLPTIVLTEEDPKVAEAEAQWAQQVREIRRDVVSKEPSIAGSVFDDADLEGPLLQAVREPNNFQVLLHRRHSISVAYPLTEHKRHEAYGPRQMSFTDAEDAILGWEPVGVLGDDGKDADNWSSLQRQRYIAEDYKHVYEKITDLQSKIVPWVERKVDGIDELDMQAAEDQEQFQTIYYQLTEQYQAVKQSSQNVLGEERSHVMDFIKDIEVLGAKLEYEINALVSKVQDVEDGVSQFERQVDDLEDRAHALEVRLKTESWPHFIVRRLTGIGTGPNIVAAR